MTEFGTAVDATLHRHINSTGAGAAVAVVQNGNVVHRQGYGLANIEKNSPMTPLSAFRICSVSKQFTCLLIRLLEYEGKLSVAHSPRRYLTELPAFMDKINIRQLCQNVSGMRDYWCLAMLTGASAETRFRRADAERIINSQRTVQFLPGSAYSYCNGNFTVLGWLIEAVTGRSYPHELHTRVLGPLGMSDTFVPAATSEALPGDIIGYEPAPDGGVMPAKVDIHWEGDAGIVSTLDDLIHWEQNFDHNRVGPPGLIETLYETPCFPSGIPSEYGFGLHLGRYRGFPYQSHEGGLRGWRMCRIRFPSEQLSVIAMFNFMADAGDIARAVADVFLPGERPALQDLYRPETGDRALDYCGFYLDRATGKGYELGLEDGIFTLNAMGQKFPLIRDGAASFVDRQGLLRISFDPEVATPVAEFRSFGANYRARLSQERSDQAFAPDRYTGVFRSQELQSTITIEREGSGLQIKIGGPLGEVAGWPVRPVAQNIVMLECQRALDHRPPGEFALWFQSKDELVVSCSLAFGVRFTRL